MSTLIIENVDLELLDHQRQVLESVCDGLRMGDFTTPEEDEALTGLLNMLDSWSDALYYKSLED